MVVAELVRSDDDSDSGGSAYARDLGRGTFYDTYKMIDGKQ